MYYFSCLASSFGIIIWDIYVLYHIITIPVFMCSISLYDYVLNIYLYVYLLIEILVISISG